MQDPDLEPYHWLANHLTTILLKPISLEFILLSLGALVLLFFSALISGAEVAFFSLTPHEIHDLREKESKRTKNMLKLIETPKKLLATILIANNFVNVSIIIILTLISLNWFNLAASPVLAFIVQVIVVTSLILLLGEIVPKVLAANFSLRYARRVTPFMHILSSVFSPLAILLVRSTSFIDKRIARKGHDISLSELSKAIEITSGKTTPEEEKMILKGIVKFGNIDVKEIMKSRIDVSTVDIETPFSELLSFILDSGYSRIPVYEGSFDQIAGILYIKDLLPFLDQPDSFDWRKLLRQAFFVPENKKINDLLQEFRSKKIHLAIVVDEYGGTSGIVTLEDVIEEIVGEINDEFDIESEDIIYSKLDNNNYVFEGKTLLNDFCKIIGVDDKIFMQVKGESDTLAGLLLELMGKIPEKDESISFNKFVFKVESVDKRRIKRIRVTVAQSDRQQ
ncbi:MAG: gliding motility-associated protein GldE [Bacteroidales bacterium]|nr:gliding motility-associated protein GldE [Bacteroidales bacterium]MDZ4203467.1 gliding motility-associated protein GldE [Bacteroidales bacterium]